jgi:hypothetical protein
MRQIPSALRSAIIAAFVMNASFAQAAINLSLGGSHSQSNAGYQKIESGAGSAGISIDLGDYFRVGYTHRQELAATTGYQLKEASKEYVFFQSLSHVTSNAVDLTLILYAGEIVTPFIFAGVNVKHYSTDNRESDGTYEHLDLVYPGPQGGAGLGIRLNQKFSLKVTYTMSPGVTQIPGQAANQTLDTYTQLGITYAL